MFGWTNFGMFLCICIVHVVIIINKYLANLIRIIFYELSKSTTIFFSEFLIKLQIYMQYVLFVVWCVMCDVPALLCVRSVSPGETKNTPGGSCMYTLSCKASYAENVPKQALFWSLVERRPPGPLGGINLSACVASWRYFCGPFRPCSKSNSSRIQGISHSLSSEPKGITELLWKSTNKKTKQKSFFFQGWQNNPEKTNRKIYKI